MTLARLATAAFLLFALAGCHHAAPKSDDQRTAEGRILPASISDAMLPYDTASSEPPPAPRAVVSPQADTTTDGAAAAADSGDPAPESQPTPAPSPQP